MKKLNFSVPSIALLLAPFFLFGWIFSGCAHSHPRAETASAPTFAATPVRYKLTQIYLKNGAIDPLAALPPPPAAGSKADRRDFAMMFRYQKNRTPQDCARAATEVHPRLANFYGPPYGPLTEVQVAEWKKFFDGAVRSDTNYWVNATKMHWLRPRPYAENPKITPCIPTEGMNPAYPSGHATISEVYALILEKLDPEKKPAIEARARQIARDRILGGVHHPSDVRAGRKLGHEIYDAFMRSRAFRQALKTLPRETDTLPVGAGNG